MSFYLYLYNWLRALPNTIACAAPLCAIVLISVWHAIVKKHKLYAALCALIHIAAFVLYLPRMELIEAFFCAALGVITNFPLAFAYKLNRPKKKKGDKIEEIARECLSDGAKRVESKFKQEKILCYTGEADGERFNLKEEEINLNHAIGLAVKLKKAKLAVGDRLEADNIYRTLTSFRAKNNLTGDELSALNGYLATLLKLTAKYSL